MNRYVRTGKRGRDTVLDGISELDALSSDALSERLAQLHELITDAAFETNDADAVLRMLRETRPVRSDNDWLFATERTALCREYLSAFPGSCPFRREIFFGSSDALRDDAAGKLAYIGNSYTDEAFSVFSAALGGAEAVVVQSFDELCEDVYGGNTEYGILPVENTDNGILLRFYSLIDKYELKIAAVCSVGTSDSGNTKFALVRKNIDYPLSPFGSPQRLELFVTIGAEGSLTELLTAAHACSMKLVRIDSLPLSYSEGSFTYCPVFGINGADTDTFLMFMSLDYPQYTPIGLFSELYTDTPKNVLTKRKE